VLSNKNLERLSRFLLNSCNFWSGNSQFLNLYTRANLTFIIYECHCTQNYVYIHSYKCKIINSDGDNRQQPENPKEIGRSTSYAQLNIQGRKDHPMTYSFKICFYHSHRSFIIFHIQIPERN